MTGRANALAIGPIRSGPKYASNWSQTYRIGVWQ
jgi:hypothetical protein